MTDEQLSTLERLARAATPGPYVAAHGLVAREEDGQFVLADWSASTPAPEQIATSRFLAAASPDVVLALVQELRAKRATIERILNGETKWHCDETTPCRRCGYSP